MPLEIGGRADKMCIDMRKNLLLKRMIIYCRMASSFWMN